MYSRLRKLYFRCMTKIEIFDKANTHCYTTDYDAWSKIVKEQNYQLGERVEFDKFLVNHYMLGQSCMINNEVYTGKV